MSESKYYRIAKMDGLNISYFNASTGCFQQKEKNSSRYHASDAGTALSDVRDSYPEAYLVEVK